MIKGVISGIRGVNPRAPRLLTPASIFIRAETVSGSYVAARSGWHDLFAWGAGGPGGSSGGTAASGGGSGAAGYSRVWLNVGQAISYALGASPNDTVLTLPDGTVLRATKGGQGSVGYDAGGAGGVATGFQVNRNGYQGGGYTNPDGNPNTSDGVSYGPAEPIGGSYLGATSVPDGAAAPGLDDIRRLLNLPDLNTFPGGPSIWVSWNVGGGGTTQGPGCGGCGKASAAPGYEGRPGQLIIVSQRAVS